MRGWLSRSSTVKIIGKELRATGVGIVLFTLLLGFTYPLSMTGIAQALFPDQANGSIINVDDQARGSRLIGQRFSASGYFWGRPSATSPVPYNAAASSGSNLGPLSDELHALVMARIAALQAADPGNTAPIPIELVTASGSGLDPEISPAAAEYQVTRVARVRGLPESAVRDLVQAHTSGRWLGIFGEPRVNVLALNLALDRLAGALQHFDRDWIGQAVGAERD